MALCGGIAAHGLDSGLIPGPSIEVSQIELRVWEELQKCLVCVCVVPVRG